MGRRMIIKIEWQNKMLEYHRISHSNSVSYNLFLPDNLFQTIPLWENLSWTISLPVIFSPGQSLFWTISLSLRQSLSRTVCHKMSETSLYSQVLVSFQGPRQCVSSLSPSSLFSILIFVKIRSFLCFCFAIPVHFSLNT